MRFVSRYFGSMAAYAFKTAPDGTRLFYSGVLWAHPYVVPDAETEQRLFRKQQWLMAIVLGYVLVTQLFLGPMPTALGFLGMIARGLLVFWIVQYFLFRTDRRTLKRAERPLSRKELFASTAARHSTTRLVLYVATMLVLLLGGVLLMPGRGDPVVVLLSIGILGLVAVAFIYMLALKLSGQAPAERSSRPTDEDARPGLG